ncbi:23642_t:CDS:2 [Cetraspora pellucida]|uniref:23642_t:CDS:1 n=1 Tax=Cetraspora pellucida TaxID=1433469 RepID=A0A9N9CV03_9GLOM|nr:23642_t:CDS:2 [Cetraspora pellucida]
MVHLNNNFALTCENKSLDDLNNITIQCTCDFRINYRGCEDEDVLLLVHRLLIPYSIFIIMISLGFIYHRMVRKGQTFFLPQNRERGILRIRPQGIFHLTTIKSLFRYPNSVIAEIGQDLSRELSIGMALIYPISIIYSTPALKFKSKTSNGTTRGQKPNKHIIDTIGIFILIAPFTTLFPFACLTGYWADVDYPMALLFTKVHYIILVLWALTFLGSVVYFWCKLIVIIWNRIDELKKKESNGKPNIGLTVSTLQRAARNLCLALFVLIVAMMLYIITVLSFCVIHKDMTSFGRKVNIGDTSSNRLSFVHSLRISQIFNSSRRENERNSISIYNYDEEISTGDAHNSTLNLQQIQIQSSAEKLDRYIEKPIVNPNYNKEKQKVNNNKTTSLQTIQIIQAEEVKHDSIKSMNSLKSMSKSSRYDSLRNSAQNSITTLSDLNIPSEDNGIAIYPSSLTPRNSYCLSPSLCRNLQLNLDEIATNNTLQLPQIAHISHVSQISQISQVSQVSQVSQISQVSQVSEFIRKNPVLHHHRSYDSSMGYIAEEVLDDDLDNKQLNNKQLNNDQLNNDRFNNDRFNNDRLNNDRLNNEHSDQNSWNDSRGSELDGVSSSASYEISPEAAALAKASWARSEEDLGSYKGNINVSISRHTSKTHSSLGLQRDSISISSDITDKQEWLKRRPTSPLVRKITIPRSGLVIKTDY